MRSLFVFPRCAHRWMLELRREAFVKSSLSTNTADRSRQSCDMSLCYSGAKIKCFLIRQIKQMKEARKSASGMNSIRKRGINMGKTRYMTYSARTCVLEVGGRVKICAVCYPKCHFLQMFRCQVQTCSCTTYTMCSDSVQLLLRTYMCYPTIVTAVRDKLRSFTTSNSKHALTLCFSTMRSSVDGRASTWSFCEIFIVSKHCW